MVSSIEYVQQKWLLLTSFSKKEDLKQALWEEIVYRYAEQHRYYHTLNHIAHLFTLCESYLHQLVQPAVVGFAIFYHDIVYDTFRDDNEGLSALIAREHLSRLQVKEQLIDYVETFIMATRDHQLPAHFPLHNDLALFLDFDVAILGEQPEVYKQYSHKIRQEYSKYNDKIYNQGRKAALQKIEAGGHIFHTENFRSTLEDQAKQNINNEVNVL